MSTELHSQSGGMTEVPSGVVYLSKEASKETKIIPVCAFYEWLFYWKLRQCCQHFIELLGGWNEIMYVKRLVWHLPLSSSSVIISYLLQHLPLKGQEDSLLKEMRSTLEIATLRSGQMNSLGMKPRYVCCNSDSWDQDLKINPEIRFIWGYISAGTKKQNLRRNLWGKLCGDLLNKSRPILPGLNVLVNLSEPKWTQLTYIPS